MNALSLVKLRRLWTQQWLSPQQLAEQRNRKLRSLVAHAYARVPYYRKQWTTLGVHPSEIASESDLLNLPLLSKTDLQSRPLTDFLAEGTDLSQGICIRTSGSSGSPLTVHLTPSENEMANLIAMRANFASGARPWRRRATLRAIDRLPQQGGFLRRPFRLDLPSGRDPKDYIQRLLQYRPAEIHGYSQSLRQLAQHILKEGIQGLRPRFVLGTAELLTPRDRALINKAFGVQMVDHYASVEARSMAWECPLHEGYHINSDTSIVEFINDNQPARPGEPARIVVTPLYMRSMPLIRYDIGDTAALAGRTCTCGRSLPLLEQLQGRRDDCITLPSGRVVLPVGSFANVIEAESDVVEYYVTQEKLDLIVVQLVLRDQAVSAVLTTVEQGIRELVHWEAVVKVVSVDSIKRDGSSKLRRIASKIHPARDEDNHP